MSPSEADLRAALRDGEGDGVDPYDIIFAVRQRRAHRRTVLLSAAAAVVLVGAAAAGGAALVNGGQSDSGGAATGAATLAGGAGGAGGSSGAAGAFNGTAGPRGAIAHANSPFGARCIAPQIRRVPTSSGTQSSGPLLPGPVKGFVVCPYSTVDAQSSTRPQPVVVTGAAARSLVASLSNTATTPVRTACPALTSTEQLALTMIPVTPDGRHLPALSATITTPACNTAVSNGATVRYGWQPPARIATLLHVRRVAPPRSSRGEMPIDLIPSHPDRESGSPTR